MLSLPTSGITCPAAVRFQNSAYIGLCSLVEPRHRRGIVRQWPRCVGSGPHARLCVEAAPDHDNGCELHSIRPCLYSGNAKEASPMLGCRADLLGLVPAVVGLQTLSMFRAASLVSLLMAIATLTATCYQIPNAIATQFVSLWSQCRLLRNHAGPRWPPRIGPRRPVFDAIGAVARFSPAGHSSSNCEQ